MPSCEIARRPSSDLSASARPQQVTAIANTPLCAATEGESRTDGRSRCWRCYWRKFTARRRLLPLDVFLSHAPKESARGCLRVVLARSTRYGQIQARARARASFSRLGSALSPFVISLIPPHALRVIDSLSRAFIHPLVFLFSRFILCLPLSSRSAHYLCDKFCFIAHPI